ncbi:MULTISPECIES: VOC family protein [Acinetobacter]|jgi:2,3-dihydroxybiphenyl 1,2-dioxygenase|uniref:Biphenyl 2,3-dioxygenase n=1 Tax=Acinetobacter chengduensis TaxID=2420890 RepID=A0ABX9TZ50_9GAMM|nr:MULTISPECIES: VOC family protein [Acinetobacter]MBI1451204.1 VOC family protein [Acinetobacter sp. FL51]RKG43666.1 biphenyl 2,3-dioxygenase [Acinetobacter sp. WCHAc060007]RLL23932.1 biphenyl 2,3-dioxygenase [Acinetobacter chengduensis]
MSHITELAYLGVNTTNLSEWEKFAVDLLGLQLAKKTGQQLLLRMDEKAYRWIIQLDDSKGHAFTGFACQDESALKSLVQNLRDHNITVLEGDANLAAERQVEHIYTTLDPLGNCVELVCGLKDADTPFQSKVLRSPFVTGQGGAGHQVLVEQGVDRKKIMDWYGLLGFKLTDVIDQEMAPGIVASVAFLHCNGRHHSLALANMPIPMKMHHFMIEVSDMSDVGLAFDRCMDAGCEFEMTLGMHPNDQMFSFYVRTPSLFSIEFGWGGLVIDEKTWQVQHLEQLSSWGHRPGHVVAEKLSMTSQH